jgi:hypothetical protein
MTITPVGSSELLADLGEEFQQLSDDLDLIDQNAATVLKAFVRTVETQTAVAKGKAIYEFRQSHPELHWNWNKFLQSKGIPKCNSDLWVSTYKCYLENKEEFSDEYLFGFSATVLAKLVRGLSFESRRSIIAQGHLTRNELQVVLSDPQEKLKKLEEDLNLAEIKAEKAAEAFTLYDGGPRNTHTNPEYQKINRDKQSSRLSVQKLEAKIAKLKEQLQLEQDKTSAAEAAKDKAEEQLNQVMFDEKTSKGLQVKRVGYNLQNMVPQVLADSQRYISEKANYPEDLRFHLDQQLTQLLTYLQTHYGN